VPLATPPIYAYAPVSLRDVLARHDEPGPNRLLSLWALALGPIALSALPSLAFRVMDTPFAGLGGYATLYLPLIFCVPLALWFGWWWGAVPAFLASMVVVVANGLSPGWALVAAGAHPVGLGVLVLAYQAAPVSTAIRTLNSFLFFAVMAFIAVLTASGGAFVWAHAAHLGASETLALWQGWWFGSYIMALAVTAPTLMLAGPAVERWKRASGLKPYRPDQISPIRLGVAFSVVVVSFTG
jgi:diguanylate cyclase